MWTDEEQKLFLEIIKKYKPQYSAEQLIALLKYALLVITENEKINLTAITSPEEFAIKHIIDSIIALEYLEGNSVIDVGTGAGMPGLIWAIIKTQNDYVLLDSLAKRVAFLENTKTSLGLKGVSTLHSRAEDAAQNPLYREKFEIATARAVANLAVLSEYCLPFVKIGGYFAALKGPDAEDEIKQCENALKVLGGKVKDVIKYQLPQEMGSRSLILIEKIGRTPRKYPRKAGTPTKAPL